MIFGFKSDSSEIVQSYINNVSDKLKGHEFVLNPFTGNIHQYEDITIFIIKPIYPNFPIYCFPFAILSYIIFGINFSVYIFVGLGCFSIFWSKRFYEFIIKRGLAKKQYKGRLEFL